MSFSSVNTFQSINTHINNLYYVTAPTDLSLTNITTSSMLLTYTASKTNGTGITYYVTTNASGTNLISDFSLNTDSALSLRYPLNGSVLNFATTVGYQVLVW